MALGRWLGRKAETEAGASRPSIGVLGAFRSGTNYARALFEGNYDCEAVYHAYGWKHGFLPVLSPESPIEMPATPCVFVTKDPYAWLVSIHRYMLAVGRNIDAPEDWDAFLRSPFTVFVQFRGRGPEYRFPTPMDYWNGLNWNYRSAAQAGWPVRHLRYETVLGDPEGAISAVADDLGLARTSGTFAVPRNEVRRQGDDRGRIDGFETDRPFDAEAYASASWRDRFSPEDVAFVSSRLDADLMEGLGYSAALP